MREQKAITVVGAGLAGSEAAYQATKLGVRVRLYEMRPVVSTPAHETGGFAELVCSNSLKSASLDNASGILKEEMLLLDSIVIKAAYATRVPAGKALAVDRRAFSELITWELEHNPLIEVIRKEITEIPDPTQGPVIIATGPLTSASLARNIQELLGGAQLYFYDSISPIIDAESIDLSHAFRASRYGGGSTEEGDYLNCPLTKDEYIRFVSELLSAEKVATKEFEKDLYFEGCLPIEVMAERGLDTLRYGPMRPVGLIDPKTGRKPYAVVQLRAENRERTMYNMVGFQTKLKYPEQQRVFRTIPALRNAEFLRYGSIHRNTYIHSPSLLMPNLEAIALRGVFFAGQIVGVEGYVESAAMGIVAGRNAALKALGRESVIYPRETSIGALLGYITNRELTEFQPMNINFGLYPQPELRVSKFEKKKLIAKRALDALRSFDASMFGSLLHGKTSKAIV